MTTYERLTPTDMQLSAFRQGEASEPIVMVSLLRFRARAAYARDYEGEKADVSGDEAFARFVEIARRRLEAIGGNVVWGAPALMTLVGPPNERWDEVLVVFYPSRSAYLDLQTDSEYAQGLVHWTAALAETRVFACKTE